MTRFFREETFVTGVLLMVLVLVLDLSDIDLGYSNSMMLAGAGLLCILYVIGGRIRGWRRRAGGQASSPAARGI